MPSSLLPGVALEKLEVSRIQFKKVLTPLRMENKADITWQQQLNSGAAAASRSTVWRIPRLSSGFPGGSVVKNPAANARDASLIPASGSSPGEGNGNPLQCSCLGNSMDKGAWWSTVHGITKSRT